MLRFRPAEPVRFEIDGTTLIFRDIGEDEWTRFVRTRGVVTAEIRAAVAEGAAIYDLLTPDQRREWDDLDASFFASCWIGAEGMAPDGVQYEQMDEEMRRQVYRDLAGTDEFRKFWPIYYRGKKKVLRQSDLPAETLDGASSNA